MAVLRLSVNEQWAVIIITGLTNIAALPGIIYMSKTQSYLHSFIGYFAFFVSIFYHIAEALPNQKLFDIHEGKWHRLDNIGCISAFNILAIYLFNFNSFKNNSKNKNQNNGEKMNKFRSFLEHFQLGLVMILQEWKPWNMRVTLFPIILFNSLILFKFVLYFLSNFKNNKYAFNWDFNKLKMAYIPMTAAIYCFYLGLDDKNDYLRIFHGLWHCFGGISTYWLWQIVKNDDSSIMQTSLTPALLTAQKRLEKDGLKIG